MYDFGSLPLCNKLPSGDIEGSAESSDAGGWQVNTAT